MLDLKLRLVEKAKEIINPKTKQEMASDLADLLAIFQLLAQANDLTMSEIESLRLDKLTNIGSFDQQVYLYEVHIPEDNSAIIYHRRQPEKYPEIK